MKQNRADAIRAHGSDAVGEHQPPCVGFDWRPAISELQRFPCLGRLRSPLLSPAHDEQNGYVPNVVYSCGALVHADTLVIPYGIADGAIGFAVASLPQLLASIVQQPDRPR